MDRAANYIYSDTQNVALVNKFIAPKVLVGYNWGNFWFSIYS